MKIERDERRFDFHDIGLAIKRAREASGMTQEQLAYIVDRSPRTIMYNENDGQHPSLNTFYQLVTMFDISVPPRHKCPIFNRDTLIVVDDLIRGVTGRLGECPNVHRALGRVILVKAGSLDLPDIDVVKAPVLLHPRRKVLFQSGTVAAVMPPFILPLTVPVII